MLISKDHIENILINQLIILFILLIITWLTVQKNNIIFLKTKWENLSFINF